MSEKSENPVITFLKGLLNFIFEILSLDIGCLLVLVVAGIIVVGWISSWPIFSDRTSQQDTPFIVNTDVYVQYQKGGEFLLQSYPATITKRTIETKNWYGRVTNIQCVMSVSGNPWSDTSRLVSGAEKFLIDNHLPLDFEYHFDDGIDGYGIDCDKDSLDLRINIRLFGTFDRDADYVLISQNTNLSYENAWIKLPVDLYDQILKSVVEKTYFSFDSYSINNPGDVVAYYVVNDGDPNGLARWVDSYLWLLEKIYVSKPIYSFSEKIVDVTSYKTVETNGHWDCNETSRYKGNCRDLDWITDTTEVPVTNQQKVIEGIYQIIP